MFSHENDIFKKLNDISVWKNSHPSSKACFTNMMSDFIAKKDCKKIEDYINKKQLTNHNNTPKSENLVVNPNYIFQESNPWIPPFYNYQPPRLEIGDRVINIKSSDIPAIPFGLRGVVTGITDKFAEVVFDEEFFGGTTCNDRFSSNRGAYVKYENLINLYKYNFII